MDTTKAINTISFFTGYGGIERGLKLAGERVNHIASCEIEAYAEANLIHKMETGALPPHPIWTDAKTFPGTDFFGKVDLFTGGFPCQPFSAAGSRNADEDPRHLWPSCLRAIESFRPTRVFLENVEGLISAKLGGDNWADPKGTPVLLHVLRELERRGYKATWGIFSAEEIGAPHRRKRVFMLAQLANSESWEGGRNAMEREKPRPPVVECKSVAKLANSETMQCNGRSDNKRELNRKIKISKSRDHCGSGRVQKLANSEHTPYKSIWPTRPGERQGPTEQPRVKPKLGRAANGNSYRVDRLRLLGNGVVPQTAALAWIELNKKINK